MSFCVGETIRSDDVPFFLEQMGFVKSSRTIKPSKVPAENFMVVVIGAGMVGINAGVKLAEAGFNYTILERGDILGGTWAANRYPGVAVDVPASVYQFSFELNLDWTRYYPTGKEYLDYLTRVAQKFGVSDRIRYRTAVRSFTWSDQRQTWSINAEVDGKSITLEANVIITATGTLNTPQTPNIPNRDQFPGVVLHSTALDVTSDLSGKRVALVGTGATACQIAPNIAASVRTLVIMQRQPSWILPNKLVGEPIPEVERWAIKSLPSYAQWTRVRAWYAAGYAKAAAALQLDPEWVRERGSTSLANDSIAKICVDYLKSKFAESHPELIDKLRPDFPVLAKRPVTDSGYLECLKRDNVFLETDAIGRFTSDGLKLTGGKTIGCDIVVMATGFSLDFLSAFDIEGRDGIKLNELWEYGANPHAYLGLNVPGYPNLFITCGPHAIALGGGHSFTSEEEVHYIVECLQMMIEENLGSLEVTRDATNRHNSAIDEYFEKTVLRHGRPAGGWLRGPNGRVRVLSRWTGPESWRALREPSRADYLMTPRRRRC